MAKKVLIIEDDSQMRKLERQLLERSGYEVLESGNAKDGTELAIKERPDVVLMDIKLPSKKRGIGAARIIRDAEETRDTPIIFVTGYIQGSETKEVANIPNCGYITKPFEIKTLIEEIERRTG